jgi:NTE family protein
MAVDYGTGRRVAFGRSGSPPARLPDAVAASCAIPGFYCAVEISGRRYVDGGVYSPSNLDVLREQPLDLVLALNPMSSLETVHPRGLPDRVAARLRGATGRRLGHEAKRLRAAGIEVMLLQPTARDLAIMGGNLMSSKRRHQVIETAIETVADHLRTSSLGERLAALPAGDPRLVSRPSGPPSTWPDFRAAARARWTELQAA